jgi:hypothetical protein
MRDFILLFEQERESGASVGGPVDQKWRTGSEGRISVLKRRHGLRRSFYPGLEGMRRWVGLGVIADNVIQTGCYLARQST